MSGALPSGGCDLFGPNGMPPGRPVDPDPTGGYYQPVRLILQADGQTVLGAVGSRILCGLPGATSVTSSQFAQDYQANMNPAKPSVGAVAASGSVTPLPPDDGEPGLTVKAGSTVKLQASWPPCPTSPCGGAETYVYYDTGTQALSMQREAMTVSWFATGGSFVSDLTGRASDDEGTTTDNTWTAPATGGAVLVWVVLRDDRGGVSWERYRLDVT